MTVQQLLCIGGMTLLFITVALLPEPPIFLESAKPGALETLPYRSVSQNVYEEYLGRKNFYLPCDRFLADDRQAFAQHNKAKILLDKDPIDLRMDCPYVLSRIKLTSYYDEKTKPVAYIRNVFTDYALQEVMLANNYSPHNSYCFAIDSKSDVVFADRIRKLAECLPNVVVLKERYNFDSAGHLQNKAQYECLKRMIVRGKWEYLMVLQNHDFAIKTNEEISTIMTILNGQQDSGMGSPNKGRWNDKLKWTADSLDLWRNKTGKTEKQLRAKLTIRKKLNQVFVSRDFVHALVYDLDLTNLINAFDNPKMYGVDEMLFTTLIASNELQLPGQVDVVCDSEGTMRWTDWTDRNICQSRQSRHSICLIGVEYMKKMSRIPHMIANKVFPKFDFGAIMCLSEMLYNRTNYFSQLEVGAYYNSYQVRAAREMQAGTFDPKKFKCHSSPVCSF